VTNRVELPASTEDRVSNSNQIKAVIASYWRYVRQCPIVALEVNSNLSSFSGEERADVLAMNDNHFLIETEIKVTLADLRRDARKKKRRKLIENRRGVTRYFYFAVPGDIANKAKLICDDLFPYAGVLSVNGTDAYEVQVYREAKQLAGTELDEEQKLRINYNQSSTVCRLAKKVDELTRVQRNLEAQLKVYRDRERLETKESNKGPPP